jgi:phage recombination protein Bet
MTALATLQTPMTVTGGNQPAIRDALRNSFYPGASDASIDMVLSYCQAGGFDPMTKPVHIVPMWDKNAKAMRDTVMPGIGLYRIIADRTGKYAGQDDAEFGPEMENWGIRFPQWCKVTLYKVSPVGRVPYSAKVFWLESYATGSKDSDAPNSMWRKRPYGQLEKCAEAAALRKAFPEVGMQPTADEMEGKVIE